ncbi:hypothetical protein LZ640_09915 [Aeromonas media]|uniref:hypothetical protein n=1 Tax=Aeromonas media TaxID=651 RepID=UPI001F1F8282|nr:hypothetical protein [Aeromonas media]MCE9924787.1 hypothetical protein [Aeromonas media]
MPKQDGRYPGALGKGGARPLGEGWLRRSVSFLIKFIFIKKQLLAGVLLALFQVFSIFGKSFLPWAGSIGRNRMRCAGDTTLDNKE